MAARRTRSSASSSRCGAASPSGERIAQDGRHLLDAGAARETVAPIARELDVRQAVRRATGREARSGRLGSRRRRRAGDDAGARLADQLARRPRRAARRRGSGGRRRRTRRPCPESTPFPRPPASGIRSRSASESRCRASDSARGAYGRSSSRSPRSSVSAQARSRSRKSPRKRATTSSPEPCECLEERARVAAPEEAAGVRDAETLRRAVAPARRRRRSRRRSES